MTKPINAELQLASIRLARDAAQRTEGILNEAKARLTIAQSRHNVAMADLNELIQARIDVEPKDADPLTGASTS